MAREHRIISWCDPCLDDGTYTEGAEFTFTIGVGKPKVVSVCTKHDKPVNTFVEFFDKYAIANPDSPRKTRATTTNPTGERVLPEKIEPRMCDLCKLLGMPDRELKNAQSQAMHNNRTHGINAEQYRAYEAGELVFVSNEDAKITLGPPTKARAAS